jgi:hypothetical protein
MSKITAITEAISTLLEAEQRFSLQRNESDDFFTEWRENLPEISAADRILLEDLRRRYIYNRSAGQLLESTVTLLLASPLLALTGFYDPPFRVRAEESVRLILQDSEEILQGRIDALVICDSVWVIILESKKTMLSIWPALPQALAYLMANPNPQRPCFGILTNGDEIVFVKVAQTECLQYDLSRVFATLVSSAELVSVLQILRQIGQEALRMKTES